MPISAGTATVNVDIKNSISWGKTSWLALIAAIAQFATALVIFLFAEGDDKQAAIAPLLGAASTLYALIKGRMDQASAALNLTAAQRTAPIRMVKHESVEVERGLGTEDPYPIEPGEINPADEERDLHDMGIPGGPPPQGTPLPGVLSAAADEDVTP